MLRPEENKLAFDPATKAGLELQKYYVNVKEFGAKGDGVTDDTEAIKSAISAVYPGGTIIFESSKTYLISEVSFEKSVTANFNGARIISTGSTALRFSGTLKRAETVVYDYNETTSKNKITLSSTAGVEKGDLLSVVSSELYDTSRLYYFKGGTVVVTNVIGNDVYFNLTFPFDMKAESINVKIYKPASVVVKNLNLESVSQLSKSLSGLRFENVVDSKIEGVTTKNYQSNIVIKQSSDVELTRVRTGRSKSESDSWDGYGIEIFSSTNVTLNKVTTKSGQHGVTTTGKEVNFNIVLNDCVIEAEVWNLGYGSHGNIYNSTINNSTLYGFLSGGNSTFNKCTVLASTLSKPNSMVRVADSPRFSNHVFTDCDIRVAVDVVDGEFIDSPSHKYVGSLSFIRCNGVQATSSVKLAATSGKTAEISAVIINQCSGFRIRLWDKVKRLSVIDSESFNMDGPAIEQNSILGVYEKIDETNIIRTVFPKRFNTILLALSGKVTVEGLKFNTLTAGTGTGSILIDNADELIFSNCDMSNMQSERGIEQVTTMGRLFISNSKLKFRTPAIMTSNLKSPARTGAVMFTDVSSNETFDVVTATDGKKYKVTIDSTGNQVRTQYV